MFKFRIISALTVILAVTAAFLGYRWRQAAKPIGEERPLRQDDSVDQNMQTSTQPSLSSSSQQLAANYTEAIQKQTPMAQLIAISPDAPANHAYDVFVGLKQWLAEDPTAIGRAIETLLQPNDGTAAQKRQRSILYGALAETKNPAAAEGLLDILQQVEHEDDAIQAAAAIGDHRAPPQRALDVLWQLGSQGSSAKQNAAILAFGSVAHRLGDAADKITGQVLTAATTAQSDEQKVELLAVMGNHGSTQYLSFLKQSARDANEDIRAAAIYGFRHLNSEDAAVFVAEVAINDTSDKVKSEAVRALQMHLEERQNYSRVADIAISTSNEEIQIEVARILKSEFNRLQNSSVKIALDKILGATRSERVRVFISSAND